MTFFPYNKRVVLKSNNKIKLWNAVAVEIRSLSETLGLALGKYKMFIENVIECLTFLYI